MSRFFIALPIDELTADQLTVLSTGLPNAHQCSKEYLHITLNFIGGCSERHLVELQQALSRIKNNRFQLSLTGVGSFLSPTAIVLWVGIIVKPEISCLQSACTKALDTIGGRPSKNTWQPHVTVGYLPLSSSHFVRPWLKKYKEFQLETKTIEGFNLYISEGNEQKTIYRLLRSFPLQETSTHTPSTKVMSQCAG